ncbi:MAG: nucleotide-diphospho-sugar transferase [Candidatus Omnitrophica bacterium]|nr:nucleotide-diphospho-sugar transferase [Candidatus Omnitrophota bacterium]
MEIKKVKPDKLFIASDGPRNKMEEEVVNSVREYVLNNIDWPCKVKTLFRRKNLGCKLAVSQAITWFFDHVEKGIILEDDCLPSQSFFKFCSKLLDRYKNNKNIMMISGSNLLGKVDIKESYFFSQHFAIWGWATWKRAWTLYDVNIRKWPKFKKKNGLKKIFRNYFTRKYYEINFDLRKENFGDTWDYQWAFACLYNNGLSITPKLNLVSNIGSIGHHTNMSSKFNFKKIYEIQEHLVHPTKIFVNKKYDGLLYSLLVPNIAKLIIFDIMRKLLKSIGLFDIFWKLYTKSKQNIF